MSEVFDDYLVALRDTDPATVATMLDAALMRGESQVGLIRDVIARGQLIIGEDWAAGRLTQVEEHVATAVAEQALGIIAQSLPSTTGGRSVVLACAEGEWHSMPARLAAEQARATGLEVSMLGGSLPAVHLYRHLLGTRPDALALSVTLAVNLVGASNSIDAAHRAGVPVIVGGAAWGSSDARARALGADRWLDDARELTAALDEVVARRTLAESPPLATDVLLLARAPAELAEHALTLERATGPRPPAPTSDQVGHPVDYRWFMRHAAAALACDDVRILQDVVTQTATAMARRGLDPHRVVAACEHLATAIESAAPRGAGMLLDEVARIRLDQGAIGLKK